MHNSSTDPKQILQKTKELSEKENQQNTSQLLKDVNVLLAIMLWSQPFL